MPTPVCPADQAIRENDVRTQVFGYHVYAYRLGASTIACTLAGVCGAVYTVVAGGANPGIVVLGYSLSLVLTVVLGERGVLFILIQFLPGGLASVVTRCRPRPSEDRAEVVELRREPTNVP